MNRPDDISITGGQAFPVPGTDDHNRHEGMTLRDYFAGSALQALLIRERDPDGDGAQSVECMADDAYFYADAMVERGAKS